MAWRTYRGREVIVNLQGDQSIAGLLFDTSKRLLTLRRAQLLRPDGSAVAIDGEVVVERERVSWVQVLPPSPEGPAVPWGSLASGRSAEAGEGAGAERTGPAVGVPPGSSPSAE